MSDDTLPATVPDLDLDSELEAEARRCAVAQWNALPEFRKARVAFDRLVETHRRRLTLKRQRAAG